MSHVLSTFCNQSSLHIVTFLQHKPYLCTGTLHTLFPTNTLSKSIINQPKSIDTIISHDYLPVNLINLPVYTYCYNHPRRIRYTKSFFFLFLGTGTIILSKYLKIAHENFQVF